jgi:uncharacterized protein (TIGR02271 family)
MSRNFGAHYVSTHIDHLIHRKVKLMRNEQNDKNRDPITGEPGSHPVGTGVGAAAGGAAGAAAGSAVGPVGTGVGAVVGAIAGGLAGKGAAEGVDRTGGNTSTGQGSMDLRRFIDFDVVDRSDDKVGTVDAVWEDHSGEPAFLSVRSGWLGMGKAHVVPAHGADVNVRARRIRLPYTAEQIKSAPSFNDQDEINESSETTIYDYYSRHGFRRPQQQQRQATATTQHTGTTQPTRATTGARTEETAAVPLREEQVKVGKREVEYGSVRLRKVVRTETVNQPVTLQREEIVVERVPANQATASNAPMKEEEIYIPLRREEPVVAKETHVREEVRVRKEAHQEQQNVQATVRKEDVEIDKANENRMSNDRNQPGRYEPKERSRR